MLVTTVIDPRVFDKNKFELSGYIGNAYTLLKAINENGLIITDRNMIILRQLVDRARLLDAKHRQRLQIPLEEVIKKGKHRVIRTPLVADEKSSADWLALANQLRKMCDCDTIIVHEDLIEDVCRLGLEGGQFTVLEDYIFSDIEQKRRRYFGELPPVDELTSDEFRDIIIRSVRFSRTLRFYDTQIGKGNNIKGFRRGIELLVKWWQESSSCATPDRLVEIYSVVDLREQSDSSIQSAIGNVQAGVVDQLKKNTGINVKLYTKVPHGITLHARYLQSEQTILNFDTGFQLLRPNDQVRKCIVHIHEQSGKTLLEWQNLPNFTMSG